MEIPSLHENDQPWPTGRVPVLPQLKINMDSAGACVRARRARAPTSTLKSSHPTVKLSVTSFIRASWIGDGGPVPPVASTCRPRSKRRERSGCLRRRSEARWYIW